MKKVIEKKAKFIIINSANRNKITLEQLQEAIGEAKLIESYTVAPCAEQDFEVKIQLFEVEQKS